MAGAAPIMMEGQPPAWTTYVSVDRRRRQPSPRSRRPAARSSSSPWTCSTSAGWPCSPIRPERRPRSGSPGCTSAPGWSTNRAPWPGTSCPPGTPPRPRPSTARCSAGRPRRPTWAAWSTPRGSWTGNEVGGMMTMPAEVPAEVPAHWLAYFGTADCDATVATATGLGATLLAGPVDIPAGRFAVLGRPGRCHVRGHRPGRYLSGPPLLSEPWARSVHQAGAVGGHRAPGPQLAGARAAAGGRGGPRRQLGRSPSTSSEASGAILVDVDGNSLIDLGAGIAVVSVGHAAPAVVEAVQDQVARFSHTCFMVNPVRVRTWRCAKPSTSWPRATARSGPPCSTPGPRPSRTRSRWPATSPAARPSSSSTTPTTAAPT